MNLKLEEYIGGARVKLTVNDAPMTAIKALVNHFVMACTDVELAQDAPVFVGVDPASGPDMTATVGVNMGIVKINPGEYEDGLYTTPSGAVIHVDNGAKEMRGSTFEEGTEPAKRKRRTKAEMAADAAAQEAPPLESPTSSGDTPAPVTPVTESSAETATATSAEVTSIDEPPLPLPDTAETAPVASADPEPASTDTSPVDTPADPVTDSDLNAFCVKVAQHFATRPGANPALAPQKVYDLCAPFVPEGMPLRPSQIRDNAQRWAFVRAAEAASGVKYHG